MRVIQSNDVKRTPDVHTQTRETVTEDSEQSRAASTIIYLTRAGSVYHTNPNCDQGGNFAPMYGRRQCMICKASNSQQE